MVEERVYGAVGNQGVSETRVPDLLLKIIDSMVRFWLCIVIKGRYAGTVNTIILTFLNFLNFPIVSNGPTRME